MVNIKSSQTVAGCSFIMVDCCNIVCSTRHHRDNKANLHNHSIPLDMGSICVGPEYLQQDKNPVGRAAVLIQQSY